MNGVNISYCDSLLFLGVLFDPKLTFEGHLERVESKARVAHEAVTRLVGLNCGLRAVQLRQLYFATVQSVIAYAALI